MAGMTVKTAQHDAHAGWQGLTAYADCRDCEFRESFDVRDHPTVLAAWMAAAKARNHHSSTHTKEIA